MFLFPWFVYRVVCPSFVFIEDVITMYFLQLFLFLPIDPLNVRESSDLFLKCQIYFVEKSCYLITFMFLKISFIFVCGISWKVEQSPRKAGPGELYPFSVLLLIVFYPLPSYFPASWPCKVAKRWETGEISCCKFSPPAFLVFKDDFILIKILNLSPPYISLIYCISSTGNNKLLYIQSISTVFLLVAVTYWIYWTWSFAAVLEVYWFALLLQNKLYIG